jgi:hypothetical protein
MLGRHLPSEGTRARLLVGRTAFEVPEDTGWLELAYRPSSVADGLHWFVAR